MIDIKQVGVDHRTLVPGIYRKSVSGFITTWDVRIEYPNKGVYLTPEIIHTIEHTMSHYLKKKYGRYRILGVYPIGDQTGFHVLTRFIDKLMIYEAIIEYIMHLQKVFIIPGDTPSQCGQCELHSLVGARKTLLKYYEHHLKFHHTALNYN